MAFVGGGVPCTITRARNHSCMILECSASPDLRKILRKAPRFCQGSSRFFFATPKFSVERSRSWRTFSCVPRTIVCETAAVDELSTPQATVTVPSDVKLPPNRTLMTVELSLPLGVSLRENEDGYIFVDAILPNGNAASDGRLKADDIIVSADATYVRDQLSGEKEVKTVYCNNPVFKDVIKAFNRDDRNYFLTVPLGDKKRTLIISREVGT